MRAIATLVILICFSATASAKIKYAEEASTYAKRAQLVLALYEGELAKSKIEIQSSDYDEDDSYSMILAPDGDFQGTSYYRLRYSLGFITLPGMKPNLFAGAVAHEIGHALGHRTSDNYRDLAVEGEADYWSALQGFAKLAQKGLIELAEYNGKGWAEQRALAMARLHQLGFDCHAPENQQKVLLMVYSYDLIHTTARALGSKGPSLSGFDPIVVTSTSKNYPSVQSRLDTLINGVLGLPRPLSWALPADFN